MLLRLFPLVLFLWVLEEGAEVHKPVPIRWADDYLNILERRLDSTLFHVQI